jgi:hypothetical protein
MSTSLCDHGVKAADCIVCEAITLRSRCAQLEAQLAAARGALEKVCHANQLGDGMGCTGRCNHWGCAVLRALAALAITPAAPPTCAEWCGTGFDPSRKVGGRRVWLVFGRDYCTEECASRYRPLRPACSEGKARSAVEGAEPRAGLEHQSESPPVGPLPATGMAGAGGHAFAECIKAEGDPPCRDCAEYAHDAVGAPVASSDAPKSAPVPATPPIGALRPAEAIARSIASQYEWTSQAAFVTMVEDITRAVEADRSLTVEACAVVAETACVHETTTAGHICSRVDCAPARRIRALATAPLGPVATKGGE